MNWDIPAETFVRLSHMALQPHETDEHNRDWLRCVRLEIRDGKRFAIASNSFAMVVQFLGKTNEPNATVNITIDPVLIDACRNENDKLMIFDNPGWAIAQTSSGYFYPNNAAGPAGQWIEWRSILPKSPIVAHKGCFIFDCETIAQMGKCSPTGNIVLPAYCDMNLPVVVRDHLDTNWLGMFLPTVKGEFGYQSVKAAEIPEWAK